jgi:hypothetical protein
MTGGARAQKKKRKEKEKEIGGCGLLQRRYWPGGANCWPLRALACIAAGEPGWPGLSPVGQIFFSFLFFYFCFLISFITFAF